MEINKGFFEKIELFFSEKTIEIISNVSQKDYDVILDSRDSDDFSNNWMKAYDELRNILKNTVVDTDYINKIESLREKSFKVIYEHTQSSDLASYVSDDIALLLESVICNYNNTWLNGLWKEYSLGKIPHGKILLVEGHLDQII